MNRLVFILGIVILLTPVGNLCAQHSLNPGVWELGGNVAYSYSHSGGNWLPATKFTVYENTHLIDLKPSVGYFFSEQWELTLEPQISIDLRDYNYPGSASVEFRDTTVEVTATQQNYSLAFLAGFFFHIPISEEIAAYVGTRTGLSWHKYGGSSSSFQYPYSAFAVPWSGADIVYPSLTIGMKIFVSQTWALAPQIEFSYRSIYNGPYYYHTLDHEFRISLGVGILAYVAHKNGA